MKVANLDSYIDYLKFQKAYSDYTVESYYNDIVEFLNYCNQEALDYKKVEYSDTRIYLMYLKEQKKDTNATINRKLSALRSFYKYLVNQ